MKVPYMITGKDLDYLTDMFKWNIEPYKIMNNILDEINTKELKKIVKESIEIFDENMNLILDTLGGYNE